LVNGTAEPGPSLQKAQILGERTPELSRRELGRWAWRQLTSMRTALLLLLLLALGAVPGSLIPQQGVDPSAVVKFRLSHPSLSPWLDRFQVFSVYSSVWFSAVYLLLTVSLVGCIVPRTAVYVRALRARPPRTPQRLERLPAHASFHTDRSPVDVLDAAYRLLRRRRFRVDVDHSGTGAGGSVRAQKGYSREAGNLIFHTSLLAVLVGVAIGSLWGYRGAVIIAEGNGFANTLTSYDEFASGRLTGSDSLPPFSLQLDNMTADFVTDGPQAGQPSTFRATGKVTAVPGAAAEPFDISVNHPLAVGGTSVFLIGSGYAPEVTVRDGSGNLLASGPVPFLPTDASYVSEGVIKVPEAEPEQLGFEGFFLPTAATGPDGIPVSAFPEAANPALSLFVYTGDLGLDSGQSQSVYTLDKNRLTLLQRSDGEPLRLLLRPGQTARLPNGLGTVTFDGVSEFARLQIAAAPVSWLPLLGLSVALGGLMLSLYVRPRRAWVRARAVEGRTEVEVAVLDRAARAEPTRELDRLVADLRGTGDPA